MVDGGEVVAALGSHIDEINGGSGLSVVYLCRELKTVKALGNAPHRVMSDLRTGVSAESEAFGKGLGNFDLSKILSWPEELMDENRTCCLFGSICDPGNCESLRYLRTVCGMFAFQPLTQHQI